jgi:hypothetical protein
MTIAPPPVTVRTLLLDSDGKTDDVSLLRDALAEHGVLGSLSIGPAHLAKAVQGALRAELADILAGVLELDIGDFILAGWRKRIELLDAARRTTATPGSRELVPLATHETTGGHQAAVDIMVDGLVVHTVRLDLAIAIQVEGMLAVIQGGRLRRIRCARSIVTATLKADGLQLARQHRTFDLGAAIRLGRDGVPLLPRTW